MHQDWRIYAKTADFKALSARYGIDPVVARVIRNRDIETDKDYESYLFGTLDFTHDPGLMLDMELGVDIIMSSIEDGENIRVVGDYDVDGVMSSYILYDGLMKAGANVSVDIPHRINDGYGINERIIDKAYNDGIHTIITCDNGIAAVNAINKAVSLGITVVVTDHHEPQEELPEADAIIDPHQVGDGYPYKDICGAVVAYKFISLLYQTMGLEFAPDTYIEEVALATVCDVMPLINENRIFVREGLKALEKTENIGLKALIEAAGLSGKSFSSYTLGFVLGPCINAAGRLGDAMNALALLTETDPKKALERATILKDLNDSRKLMTEEGEERALNQMGDSIDDVLVVYVSNLHESLAGIVAGRIKERFYRPTIVFTDTEGDKSILKGSGRSIDAYNMFEKINAHKDLLVKFGGHPLAAGLSLKKENLDELRRVLNEEAGLSETDKIPKLMIDVPMPMSYVTMNLAEQLASLEPFGKGNEYPLFAEKDMEILGYRIYGQTGNVMKLKLRSTRGSVHEVIYFRPDEFEKNINEWFTPEECDKMLRGIATGRKLFVAYEVSINEFNGTRSVQFQMKAYEPA
ncbi:MAG: single-stranded-DNA-specific exonuclease RecJ [Eubacterium sp.]|nr:single-stranded-DNA-specific exonuclease RecJ [Eubacterium sp.]